MDGGEGFVGRHYLMAWRIESLLEWNRDYMVEETAPELLLFGSNGGGEGFAFDSRGLLPLVVAVPFITMNLNDAITLAPTFDSFLQHLYRSDSLFDSDYRKSQRGDDNARHR
jgi:hypothetical protein